MDCRSDQVLQNIQAVCVRNIKYLEDHPDEEKRIQREWAEIVRKKNHDLHRAWLQKANIGNRSAYESEKPAVQKDNKVFNQLYSFVVNHKKPVVWIVCGDSDLQIINFLRFRDMEQRRDGRNGLNAYFLSAVTWSLPRWGGNDGPEYQAHILGIKDFGLEVDNKKVALAALIYYRYEAGYQTIIGTHMSLASVGERYDPRVLRRALEKCAVIEE